MPRLLLVLILSFASAAQAAQSIAPGVYRALQEAQNAQQRGDYGAARKTLQGAGAKPGSIEQALVWRPDSRNPCLARFLELAAPPA